MAEVNPNAVEPNSNPPLGCEFITLAGKQWPITKTGPRQNRIIVPLGFKVIRRLGPILMTLDGLNSLDPEVKQAAMKRVLLSTTGAFFETEDLDMLTDIVFAAISRNNKISKEQFLDMDSSMNELLAALPLCLKMAGLEIKEKDTNEPGEGEAKSQTGTI